MPLLLPPATATASTTASASSTHSRCPVPLPLAARRSQVRSRTWSPSAAGPLPQQQPLHSSRVALRPAPVSQRVRMPGFESDRSGQDRLLIQCSYRRHPASSCSLFACASDGMSRAGLLSLTRSIVPRTPTLADNRAPTAALRFYVRSRAAATFV